jgi:hypothetical protein
VPVSIVPAPPRSGHVRSSAGRGAEDEGERQSGREEVLLQQRRRADHQLAEHLREQERVPEQQWLIGQHVEADGGEVRGCGADCSDSRHRSDALVDPPGRQLLQDDRGDESGHHRREDDEEYPGAAVASRQGTRSATAGGLWPTRHELSGQV